MNHLCVYNMIKNASLKKKETKGFLRPSYHIRLMLYSDIGFSSGLPHISL